VAGSGASRGPVKQHGPTCDRAQHGRPSDTGKAGPRAAIFSTWLRLWAISGTCSQAIRARVGRRIWLWSDQIHMRSGSILFLA